MGNRNYVKRCVKGSMNNQHTIFLEDGTQERCRMNTLNTHSIGLITLLLITGDYNRSGKPTSGNNFISSRHV
jgi:hypothetical protein